MDIMGIMSVALLAACALIQASQPLDRSEAGVSLAVPADSKGFSLVLSAGAPRFEDPAEPNAQGAFGVGFDTYNPKETNPFNANGNIYDRPQREVSLHWNGVELANKLSLAEIKSVKPQDFKVKLEKTLGGSLVTVTVDKTNVYDRYFVPFLAPFAGAWTMVGAEGTVKAKAGRPIKAESSTKIKVFDKELNDAGRHKFSQVVTLPENVDKFGRVIGTLTLGPTPKGIDPWDRLASLALVDAFGQRIELVRCITPYRKGWTWTTDITHLLPKLKGKNTFTWECETWGEGWLISFDLDYFEGRLKQRPFQVMPLWQGTFEIGTGKPLPQPTSVTLPKVKKAEVYTTVTGHGMSPNTSNAAEFFPLWRRLGVNGKETQNTLWYEECYLNPCRPQGGTWKYDRAGWAPGSVPSPWVVDVTKDIKTSTTFTYTIQPYVNKTPVDGNPARHVIESVLVLWK